MTKDGAFGTEDIGAIADECDKYSGYLDPWLSMADAASEERVGA